jgi:hypothetical protein
VVIDAPDSIMPGLWPRHWLGLGTAASYISVVLKHMLSGRSASNLSRLWQSQWSMTKLIDTGTRYHSPRTSHSLYRCFSHTMNTINNGFVGRYIGDRFSEQFGYTRYLSTTLEHPAHDSLSASQLDHVHARMNDTEPST